MPTRHSELTPEMTELLSDRGWVHRNTTADGIEVYSREMTGRRGRAAKAVKEMSVSAAALVAVLGDENRFAEFLAPVYVHEARILNQNLSDFHDVYQYLDLPGVMKDRHFVVRVFTEHDLEGVPGHHRIWWTALPRRLYEDFVSERERTHGRPLYIATTEGSWEIEPLHRGSLRVTYRLFTDPGGAIPGWLASLGNRSSLPDVLRLTEREAERR